MFRAYLTTEDEQLSSELCTLEIEGVRVLVRLQAAVQWDQVAQHVIEFSSERAIDFFIAWLVYKKAQKITKKTVINGVDIFTRPLKPDQIAKNIKAKIEEGDC